MINEHLLEDVFAHEAGRAPEPDAVLSAVHERIAHRRRVVTTRAATVLASAAAVTALAVGVTALNAPADKHHEAPAAAGPASFATAGRPVTVVTSAPDHRPASSAAAPLTGAGGPDAPSKTIQTSKYDYSTIDAGWLPGPARQDSEQTFNNPGFEQRDWTVSVDGSDVDVVIWTQQGSLPSRMQAAGGKRDYTSVTINGHEGRQFRGANATIVAFDRGNGTVAYVGPSIQQPTDKVTSSRIAQIALKVAQNMQFDQHDPIPGR